MTLNKKYLKIAGVVLLVVVIVLLVVVLKKKPTKEERRQEALKPFTPEITKVEILPENPTKFAIVHARATLRDPKMKPVITFHYNWYVEDQLVLDVDSKILDRKYYKKGDMIYCRVKAEKGVLKSEFVESNRVKIGNSIPLVTSPAILFLRPPGQFSYKVKATDPDEEQLTYRLVSPKNVGIQVNFDTGHVYWDVDEDTLYKISKLLPTVLITVEVRDRDGGSAEDSINLHIGDEPVSPI